MVSNIFDFWHISNIYKYFIPFYILCLVVSLEECLSAHMDVEFLVGENSVECDKCRRIIAAKYNKTPLDFPSISSPAEKSSRISTPPANLVLHLKRFLVTVYRNIKLVCIFFRTFILFLKFFSQMGSLKEIRPSSSQQFWTCRPSYQNQ